MSDTGADNTAETMPSAGRAVLVFQADQHPAGAFLPGVPLRDLTAEDLARLPEWLRKTLDATGWWTPAPEEDLTDG